MSKTKAGPVSGDRIKSFIERVEKLLEERKAIQGDIRDVFAEAKGVGYDVKTMRKLITIRAMDAADRAEQETLLDTYAHAIGMEASAHLIEPSEEELIDRASKIVREVDQCMDLVEGGKPPKIAAIQEAIGCSLGKASKLRAMVSDRISRSNAATVKNENEIPPEQERPEQQSPVGQAAPLEATDFSGGRGVGDSPAPHGLAPSEKGPSTPSDAVPLPVEAGQDCAGAGNVAISEQPPERMPPAAPPLNPKPDLYQRITGSFKPLQDIRDDDLAIPPFLRRVSA